jgi:hypothetical protein
MQYHEWLFVHSLITAANINEICCCGAATDALAVKADRDAICGGTACTSL